MNKLSQYLNERRKGDFARRLGIPPSYLSQILSGHRRPGFDLMVKIRNETDGAVDLDSWAGEAAE